MRPVIQRVSAAGFGPWIPINYLKSNFSVGLAVIPSSNAAGPVSYTVQHTFDDIGPQGKRDIFTTQAASTTATVTDRGLDGTGHGLSVNDSVVLDSTGVGIDGTYQVASVVSQTQYTVTTAVNQTANSISGARGSALRVFNHAVLVAQAARADGNYAFEIGAVRLLVATLSAGYIDFIIRQSQGQ